MTILCSRAFTSGPVIAAILRFRTDLLLRLVCSETMSALAGALDYHMPRPCLSGICRIWCSTRGDGCRWWRQRLQISRQWSSPSWSSALKEVALAGGSILMQSTSAGGARASRRSVDLVEVSGILTSSSLQIASFLCGYRSHMRRHAWNRDRQGRREPSIILE